MLVLVTGGAGFIGSHIVTELLDAGHEVRVLDVLLPAAHSAPPPEPPAGVGFRKADVRDPAAVREALRGVDAVCHQAAMVGLGKDFGDAPDYVSCNDLGTAVLLAAMAERGVRRLVLAGSMVVYGEGRYECAAARHRAAGAAAGRGPGGGTVRAAVSRVRRTAGVGTGRGGRADRPAQRLRRDQTRPGAPGRGVGAGRPAGRRGRRCATTTCTDRGCPGTPRTRGWRRCFRSALAAGEAPRVFEDGGQRRDFVHVRDVAGANVVALAALLGDGAAGALRAYNVGSGTPHTVGEMATALAALHGGPPPVVTGEYRLGDVRHITATSQRVRAELGWSARIGFAEGMAEFAGRALRAAGAVRALTAGRLPPTADR